MTLFNTVNDSRPEYIELHGKRHAFISDKKRKYNVIYQNVGVRLVLWSGVYSDYIKCRSLHAMPSSSTTNRELQQQFPTFSGWKRQ